MLFVAESEVLPISYESTAATLRDYVISVESVLNSTTRLADAIDAFKDASNKTQIAIDDIKSRLDDILPEEEADLSLVQDIRIMNDRLLATSRAFMSKSGKQVRTSIFHTLFKRYNIGIVFTSGTSRLRNSTSRSTNECLDNWRSHRLFV